MKPLLVVITGSPGTGKTTLGRHLSERHELPLISKDGLKETLFGSLGWKDREWSRKLSQASLDLMFYLISVELVVGRSLIVESNFRRELDTGRFLALKRRCPFLPLQIVCRTDPHVLATRLASRAQQGQRHPGHVDHLLVDELDPIVLQGTHSALGIGGLLFEVDTTWPDAVDSASISRAIASALGERK